MTDETQTRVLIAEDDFIIAQRLVSQLSASGYEVVGTARDGIEAVAMAVELRPDVTILDLHMPVQGGIAAAKQIRERQPMPIVIVTAYHSAALVKECSEAGAGAYLVKPVGGSELMRAIEIARTRFAELAELHHYRHQLEELVTARTEELSRANAALLLSLKAKDTLLANMSHELRTPLNAILGLSEALQEEVYGPLAPKQLQSLKTIEGSGKRLLSLINNVLDFSRLEAHQIELDFQEFDPEVLCSEILMQIRSQAQNRKIEIQFASDGSAGRLQADAQRLRQILLVLLDNALKFTEESGNVGLELYRRKVDGAVCFVVWDGGRGVSAEELPFLMKPFTQGSEGLARQHEGAGLGLALAARLLELHRGSLEVSAEPGKGSRFTVVMPGMAMGG